jgi:hypothetical protein
MIYKGNFSNLITIIKDAYFKIVGKLITGYYLILSNLKDVIVKYYYNPLTKGSNSIKAVLPAVLQSSEYLQNKYSKSIKELGISSKNFDPDQVWIQKKNNQVINPYKLLERLFKNWNDQDLEEIISDIDSISDGGQALIAYAKLQFEDMKQEERQEIKSGLLKYCELDTLAMVMVYEHLREVVRMEK